MKLLSIDANMPGSRIQNQRQNKIPHRSELSKKRETFFVLNEILPELSLSNIRNITSKLLLFL